MKHPRNFYSKKARPIAIIYENFFSNTAGRAAKQRYEAASPNKPV